MTAGAPPAAVDRGRLSLLAVGHAFTDSYAQSLLAPIFPILAVRLSLSLKEIGALTAVMGLSSSLGQPIWGYVSDRWPRIPLVAIGPALAACCITSVGRAEGFWSLAALLFATGLGVGAFHPQGASLARDAARGNALAMSAFTVGGNVGFGLAPLLATAYLFLFGLDRLSVAAVPGLLYALVLLLAFAGPAARRLGAHRRFHSAQASPARVMALGFLTATVVVRSAVQISMTAFLPFLVASRFPGLAPTAAAGIAVSTFLLASALSGPLGGHLSDRFGRRRVMVASFLLAPWPMLMGFHLPGFAFVAALGLGGFILMLPHPANVVMAQEFLPRSAAIGASMITGLAWGLAQLIAGPVGVAAERYGIEATLMVLCLAPLLGALLVLPIPDLRRAPALEPA